MKQYTVNDLESAVFRFVPAFREEYNEGVMDLSEFTPLACIEIIQQRQAHTDHDVEIIRQAEYDLQNKGEFNFKENT